MLRRLRQNAGTFAALLGFVVLLVRVSGTHHHFVIDSPVESPAHEWAHHPHGDHHAAHGHAPENASDLHAHAHGELDKEVTGLTPSHDRVDSWFADIALVASFLALFGLAVVSLRARARPPDDPPLTRRSYLPLKTGPPAISIA